MKERPILFSAAMVRALLAGTKTQTRRVVKPQPPADKPRAAWFEPGVMGWAPPDVPSQDWHRVRCPYGIPPPLATRPIPSTGGRYSAGDDGRIYSGAAPLKPWFGGYEQQYAMVSAGDQRKAYIHRLVCEAFYGDAPEGLPEVRHLDGDPSNNRPENLDWGTKEQNAADRSAHGRATGEAHPSSKLTAETVAEIRALRGGMTRPALAARFGVSRGTVDDVLDGRTWTERAAPPPNMPRYQRPPGQRLWVREAWRSGRLTDRFPPREMTLHPVWYEADGPAPDACNGKLRPGMFMPRWASRITLEVTGVRVERLQSISHEDAWDEGIRPGADGLYSCPNASFAETPVDAYRQLWEHLNGPKSWAENPWVWVVCFRRIEV